MANLTDEQRANLEGIIDRIKAGPAEVELGHVQWYAGGKLQVNLTTSQPGLAALGGVGVPLRA